MKNGLLFFLLASVFFTSCGGKQNRIQSTGNPEKFSAKIILSDSAFALGSEIDFKLVFRPGYPDTFKLMFPNACRTDFIVMKDGFPIWSQLNGKSCAQVISYGKIPPRDSLVVESKWSCTTNDKKGAILGKYSVKGLLLSNPPIETEPVFFYLVD
jgi:hypothetical protein